MLFRPPPLDDVDLRVVAEIEELRSSLRFHLHEPRRWRGQLGRNLRARAIQGSNSIEGYDVSLDDAVALLADEEALDTDRATVLEIVGYRNALTYVQQLAEDDVFSLDESLLRSLHFMMLGHDLSKSPGRYRRGPVFVVDEERRRQVYEGPPAERVADLVTELVTELATPDDACPPYVRAAMAHLNLVMIHPFRDGNGRMARALQTLVLARERVLAPEFSSIEEWLGRNTADYYAVLTDTGAGGWHPDRPTRSWTRFNLAAHHMQAQTVLRRIEDAGRLWTALEQVTRAGRLADRAPYALHPAAQGLRVRRAVYEKDAEVETGTAARDLRIMVDAGLLQPKGETRARYYVGTQALMDVARLAVGERPVVRDPYAGVDRNS